jgi:hypothetical protein
MVLALMTQRSKHSQLGRGWATAKSTSVRGVTATLARSEFRAAWAVDHI